MGKYEKENITMAKKLIVIYSIATIVLLWGMKLVISGVFASMTAATQSLF